MKLTKLTVDLHIAISQNRCTRFYSGKPVFSANSVSFTPSFFTLCPRGGWRGEGGRGGGGQEQHLVLTARSRRKGKKVSREKKINYTIVIKIYNNYINNNNNKNAIKTKIEIKRMNRTQTILFFAWEAKNEGAINSVLSG